MKLSLILGGLLFVTIAGSGWYINYLGDQISTLKGNQIVLETQIQEQNESIERYLCLLYTSPSPRDGLLSRMPSSA